MMIPLHLSLVHCSGRVVLGTVSNFGSHRQVETKQCFCISVAVCGHLATLRLFYISLLWFWGHFAFFKGVCFAPLSVDMPRGPIDQGGALPRGGKQASIFAHHP